MVSALAGRKAAAVASQRPDALVLGCDSLLECGQVRFGTPTDAGLAAYGVRSAGRWFYLCTRGSGVP